MEDLIKKLEKTCEKMELITELTKKYRDNKVVAEMLINKKIEDGILAKLHLASLTQLSMLKKTYKFRYYSNDMVTKLIENQVLKTKRKEKLQKIEKASL